MRSRHWLKKEVDSVVRPCSALSHYDEPVEGLADTIRYVQDGLPRMSSSRVTVYSKKLEGFDRHGLQRLLKETKADEVVALANVGREGETYLVSTRSASLIELPAATDLF
jgi:hypothetical protein